ncbi:MBOAT family O-acyltransferase [Viscerimonas tarda]
MFFDSLQYALFLPVVFILYWLVFRSYRWQNALLLAASFFFYSCWDWRFVSLLAFSILINYWAGLRLSKPDKHSKLCLTIVVIANLAVLCFFKYFNFFIESFNDLLISFGSGSGLKSLHIILPVGISFYTFHGLSYIFDIYNKKIEPTRNIIDYSLFVSYFPLLVAGPIERASHLLPQVKKPRLFSYRQAADGLKQILWGLFKKLAIADVCGQFADRIFDNSANYSASTLLLGGLYFTCQIYCDFSGYSDIALGTSRLFGIELLKNFNYPYFSRNIAEFWRRWHISLSSWFRDYLYIPLGGSRGGTWMRIRNTFIIFIASGFWHGANWTFIFWGGLNAFFILPSIVLRTNRKMLNTVAENRLLPNIKELGQLLLTFVLCIFAWIVFRANSITHAYEYITGIFNKNLFSMPEVYYKAPLVLFAFLMVVEWFARTKNHGLENLGSNWPRAVRWAFYYLLIILILAYKIVGPQQFIYFQF